MTTPMIRHVLVPVDFEPCSQKAVDVAVAIAKQHHAKLTLLNVVEVQVAAYPGVPFAPTIDFTSERTLVAEAALEAQLEKIPAEIERTTVIRHGSVSDEILKAAEELHVDLLVVGTHGRTGLSRLLIGSTAEKVVRSAPVPVLTVRADVPITPAP